MTRARFLFLLLLGTSVVVLAGDPAQAITHLTDVETGEALPLIAAWSPDGARLAYGTETEFHRRRYSHRQEDIDYRSYPGEVWVTDFADKPKRILERKLIRDARGRIPSFTVTGLAWSPDSAKLAVEITNARKESATFLLTAGGKRLRLGDSRRNFVEGYGAGWLGDNQQLCLLTEALAPRLLHRVQLVRTAAGRQISLFREKTFAAVAWLPNSHRAVMVERDREFTRPPRLLLGNLENGTVEDLGEVESYLGGLQVTPDEARVSYFIGQNELAVRPLDAEAAAETMPLPFARYQWSADGRIFFLEPEEVGRSEGWLVVYDPARETRVRLLPEQLLHDFWLAPDGRQIAVLTAEDFPRLEIYRLGASAAVE